RPELAGVVAPHRARARARHDLLGHRDRLQAAGRRTAVSRHGVGPRPAAPAPAVGQSAPARTVGQARPVALAAAPDRGLPPICWIHGDEALLALEAADMVRAAARAAGASERMIFEGGRGFKPEAMAAEAGALSLFGDGKLLELRLPAKPGKEIGQFL